MNTMTVSEMEKLFGARRFQSEPTAPAPKRIVVLALAPLRAFVPFAGTACCASAVSVACTCRASWKCATHGATCVGSHD